MREKNYGYRSLEERAWRGRGDGGAHDEDESPRRRQRPKEGAVMSLGSTLMTGVLEEGGREGGRGRS